MTDSTTLAILLMLLGFNIYITVAMSWYVLHSPNDPVKWAIRVLQEGEKGGWSPDAIDFARIILDFYLNHWR